MKKIKWKRIYFKGGDAISKSIAFPFFRTIKQFKGDIYYV